MYLQILLILTITFGRNVFSEPTKGHFQGILNSQSGPNLPTRDAPSVDIPRYVHHNCSPIQTHTERQAWAEAERLLRALELWANPGSSFSEPSTAGNQSVMDMYMGTDSGVSSTGGPWLRAAMFLGIQKLRQLYSGTLYRDQIYVYCDESDIGDSNMFSHEGCDPLSRTCCNGDTNTYSWDFVDYQMTIHVLVLCPRFFAAPTLSEQIRYVTASRPDLGFANDSNKIYGNIGAEYFRQSLYWASIFDIDTTNSWGDNNETVATTRLGEDINMASKSENGRPSRKVSAINKSKGNLVSARDDATLRDSAALTALENPAQVILTNDPVAQGEQHSYTRPLSSAAQTDNAMPTRPALHHSASRKIKGTVRSSRALKHSTVRTKTTARPKKTDTPAVKCNSGNPACAKNIASSANTEASFQSPDSWTIAAGALFQMQTFGLILPPKPGQSTPGSIRNTTTDYAYSGPASKFLGHNISASWLDYETQGFRTAGPSNGVWISNVQAYIYSDDYGTPTKPGPPRPSCIAPPYSDTSVDGDSIFNTYAEKACDIFTYDPSAEFGRLINSTSSYWPLAYSIPENITMLWISASLVQHPECSPSTLLKETCMAYLNSIVKGCGGSGITDKYSGSVVADCVVYEIQTVPGMGAIAATPPKGVFAQSGGWYGY